MIVARDTSASKNRVRSAKELWELELLCLLMTPQIPLVQIGQPAPWRDKLIGGRDMFSLLRGWFSDFQPDSTKLFLGDNVKNHQEHKV